MRRKILFYELNEVPQRIFDHFAAARPGSAIGQLRRQARWYRTVSEDHGHLSPWITWPTVHRGVTNAQHGISDFGMDLAALDRELPPIWRILSRAGARVGVFGSLHSHPLPADVEDYAFFVPDTFAAGPECFPARYEAFQSFNLAMAAINGRSVGHGVALREAARFLAAAPGLGLRGRTAAKLAAQVVSERLNPDRLVRRRTSQAQIAFDFFLRGVMRERPDAAFFFTNHVASSLHRYWPALFPDDYEISDFGDDWRQTWRGEIPHAVTEADAQIAHLKRFVERDRDYLLVLCTSMGQSADDGRMPVETELVIADFARFMDWAGVAPGEWARAPAMNPQYNVRVSEGGRDALMATVPDLAVHGRRPGCDDLGGGVVRLELNLPNVAAPEITFRGRRLDPAELGLRVIHLQDAAGANAYHIPEGVLSVYDPRAPERGQPPACPALPTTEIAPWMLRNFGVPVPAHMAAGPAL